MTTPAYHHGNLREELVRHAVELAREKGEEGVVLREVARRAAVSHNAAYRHFADRDELLTAVGNVGMSELAAQMQARTAKPVRGSAQVKATRRLREIGRAYVEYALAEPGMFGVAFGHADKEMGPEEPGPYELLSEALDGMLAAGVTTPDRRENAEIMCWSAVHGFSMLSLEGPLRAAPKAERDRALEELLDQVHRSLTG